MPNLTLTITLDREEAIQAEYIGKAFDLMYDYHSGKISEEEYKKALSQLHSDFFLDLYVNK